MKNSIELLKEEGQVVWLDFLSRDHAGVAGIDLAAIGEELLSDGLAAFDRDFESLLDALEAGLLEARSVHA